MSESSACENKGNVNLNSNYSSVKNSLFESNAMKKKTLVPLLNLNNSFDNCALLYGFLWVVNVCCAYTKNVTFE